MSNQINTHCTICHAATKITKGRSHLCPRCKANLTYISNHFKDSEYKLLDLKIRYLALNYIKAKPMLGTTDALRLALNIINSEK